MGRRRTCQDWRRSVPNVGKIEDGGAAEEGDPTGGGEGVELVHGGLGTGRSDSKRPIENATRRCSSV